MAWVRACDYDTAHAAIIEGPIVSEGTDSVGDERREVDRQRDGSIVRIRGD